MSRRPREPSALPESAGLSVTHPRPRRRPCALGVFAIAGLPPFGVFMSEFLILTTTFAREPWLAILPAFGLLVGFGALLWRLQDLLFGEPTEPAHRVDASSVPLVMHLRLVLIAGHLPAADPGRAGSSAPRSCSDERPRALAGRSASAAKPAGPDGYVALAVDARDWIGAGRGLCGRACRISGALGDEAGCCPHGAAASQHSACGPLCRAADRRGQFPVGRPGSRAGASGSNARCAISMACSR